MYKPQILFLLLDYIILSFLEVLSNPIEFLRIFKFFLLHSLYIFHILYNKIHIKINIVPKERILIAISEYNISTFIKGKTILSVFSNFIKIDQTDIIIKNNKYNIKRIFKKI